MPRRRPLTGAEVNEWIAALPPFDGAPSPRGWVRLCCRAGRVIWRWGR